MSADEFTCAVCGGVFEKAWTDDEAVAESQRLFGDWPPGSMVTLCEGCFAPLRARFS